MRKPRHREVAQLCGANAGVQTQSWPLCAPYTLLSKTGSHALSPGGIQEHHCLEQQVSSKENRWQQGFILKIDSRIKRVVHKSTHSQAHAPTLCIWAGFCCFVFFSKHCQPRDHISTSNLVWLGQRRKLRPGYVCDQPKVTLMGSCFPLSSKCWMSADIYGAWTWSQRDAPGFSTLLCYRPAQCDLREVTGSSGKTILILGILMWEVAGMMLLSQSFEE